MPAVVSGAALSAAFAGVTSGFTAAVIGGAFLKSLVLGGLAMALSPKPKKPSSPSLKPGGNTVAVNQSDLIRPHIYGHTRIVRGYAHMQSTGVNGTMHGFLMLCEGPLRAINEIWVNDYCIPSDWIDDEGNVTEGRYAGKLILRKHLGTETQGADSRAILQMDEWTESDRLAGIAYVYIEAIKDQDLFPTGWPNYTAIVEGPARYDPRALADVWTTNMAIHARDFITNEEYGFGALTDDINDTNMAAQANICDEIVDVTAQVFDVAAVDITLNLIELDGNILTLCFGDRCTIASTGAVPGGLAAATAYYVFPYQVKGNDEVGPRIGFATSLANAMLKTGINITDVGSGTITITKTGEPRYHGSGVVDTDTELTETLNDLCNSMAGRAINTGGQWTLLAGAWRSPENSYGIGDLRAAINVKRGVPMSDMFNVTKGLFVSPASFYQPTDYPSVRYQTFVDQDGGLEQARELNLRFTDRATTAQRIAKIELFRARQDIVFKGSLSAAGLQNQPGDNVGLTIDRLGWDDKYFEITEFSLSVANNVILTDIAARETAQAIFDWTSGEAIDFDPAPNTDLPDAFNVLAVQGASWSSRFIETVDADSVGILSLTWAEHPDAFVREYGDFEIQYKLSASLDWLPSFFVDGALTATDIVTSSVNVFYDIRIRARNSLGVRSGWTTLTNATIGSSGGVGTSNDWGNVFDAPGASLDYGAVNDSVGTTDDWGYVT